jgi:predicted aspartyl protease
MTVRTVNKMVATVVTALLCASSATAEEADVKAGLEMAIAIATKTPPHRCFVPIIKPTDEQSFWVPVIINRAGAIFFIVDTGFTGDLVISRSFLDMLRTVGYLSKLDRNGPIVKSTLADGSEITQQTVVIREIILPGCRAFTNVLAIISPAGSSPLLGQGVLSRFQYAGIDQTEGGLILVPHGLPRDLR